LLKKIFGLAPSMFAGLHGRVRFEVLVPAFALTAAANVAHAGRLVEVRCCSLKAVAYIIQQKLSAREIAGPSH